MSLGPDAIAGRAPIVEFVDVVKTFPGTPPVVALDQVSLRVVAGELVAVVGPSGSGKSTLLHLAGALDRPTSGTVRIDGRDVTRFGDGMLSSLRGHRIGFVFQQFALLDGLSAADNVAVTLLYRGLPRATRRVRALEALERVGLGHRAGHRPGELSGGEQQRVAIARALAGAPSIVLADEPTGNLDSTTGLQLLELFHALHRDGVTIAIVTHDVALAAALPRVVTIRDGQVESDAAIGSAA